MHFNNLPMSAPLVEIGVDSVKSLTSEVVRIRTVATNGMHFELVFSDSSCDPTACRTPWLKRFLCASVATKKEKPNPRPSTHPSTPHPCYPVLNTRRLTTPYPAPAAPAKLPDCRKNISIGNGHPANGFCWTKNISLSNRSPTKRQNHLKLLSLSSVVKDPMW